MLILPTYHMRQLCEKPLKLLKTNIETYYCSTETTAFSYIAHNIADSNDISYTSLKIEMKRRFFGDDYIRTLQNEYRELTFRKGMVVNTFIDDLNKTIHELFDTEEVDTISAIAINHVISNLEEELRQAAKIFPLSVVIKMEGNRLNNNNY